MRVHLFTSENATFIATKCRNWPNLSYNIFCCKSLYLWINSYIHTISYTASYVSQLRFRIFVYDVILKTSFEQEWTQHEWWQSTYFRDSFLPLWKQFTYWMCLLPAWSQNYLGHRVAMAVPYDQYLKNHCKPFGSTTYKIPVMQFVNIITPITAKYDFQTLAIRNGYCDHRMIQLLSHCWSNCWFIMSTTLIKAWIWYLMFRLSQWTRNLLCHHRADAQYTWFGLGATYKMLQASIIQGGSLTSIDIN